MRTFYNRNVAALPVDAGARLCKELRRDTTMAKHFELVVGRLLQRLGATGLEYEALGGEGRRVDWSATFGDGVVSVEATAPVANAVIGSTLGRSQRLVDMVVKEAPAGWFVMVHRLPDLPGDASLRRIRSAMREKFAAAPAPSADAIWEVAATVDGHEINVGLVAASDPSEPARYGGGPGVGYIDNTSSVVRRAIEGKRDQVRGSPHPVLAAVTTWGFGENEIDKFDQALLGQTVWRAGTGDTYFQANGVLRPGETGKEPTFAGVLAFHNLGWRGGPDPVLYVHPRFNGSLPLRLLQLRRRFAGASGVEETAPALSGLVDGMGWPTA